MWISFLVIQWIQLIFSVWLENKFFGFREKVIVILIPNHIHILFVVIFYTEADRDTLDWSGRKPLDYRKQSTSISASTYSSKYDSLINCVTASTLAIGLTTSKQETFGSTLKLKRTKRFPTLNGALMRSHSMKNFIKSPSTSNFSTTPKRTTCFSPELEQGKRNQKLYRSILFRKKSISSSKNDKNDVDNK